MFIMYVHTPRACALCADQRTDASTRDVQVYVCQKNAKLDNEKDLKKKHEELIKAGKKIKKKGPKKK